MNLSHTTHEPPLKNYYDAAESSGGAIPQFEYTPGPDSTLDFSKPLVKPETLTGIEIGYSYKIDKFHLDLNFYHMSFVNEIVKDGGLDQLGSPTTGNARHTVHQGFEAGIYYQILPQISLEANGVISKNILVEHTIFVEEESGFVNPINLDGNKVAGFPDQLANIGLIYSWAALYIKFNMKYVGKFYTDNTQNELLSVNPYNTFNLYFKYSIDLSSPLKLSIQGRINNLLDNRYLAHGIGEEFYPAAGRNWFLGLNFDY
jgi:iron complex outermembrane receptor protein